MNTSPETDMVPVRDGDSEKTGLLELPISRRGAFAALACAAGLALLGPARKAEALAGMNFNLGQGWFGAAADSLLVHSDPRQGEGDMFFGFAKHAVSLGNDRVAQRRETHDAAGALDERLAEQRFEFAHPRRQR